MLFTVKLIDSYIANYQVQICSKVLNFFSLQKSTKKSLSSNGLDRYLGMVKSIQSLNYFKKFFILIAALSIMNCKKMNDYESINLSSAIPPSLLETGSTSAPVVVNPPAVQMTWVKCADEAQVCSFTGTRRVLYSTSTTDSRQSIKTFTGSTPCTNAVFTDVAPGVIKFCYYENQVTTSNPPVVVNPPPTTSAELDFQTGSDLYAKNCALCHGQLSVTGKAKSSTQLITAAIGSITQMKHLSVLTAREVELISLALYGKSQVVSNGSKTLYTCDSNSVRLNSILKLSNREFAKALSLLMNDFGANLSSDSQLQNLFNAIPSDIAQLKFAKEENSFLLSSSMVNAIFNATFRAATLVSNSGAGLTNYPNTANCLGGATVTQACHQSFVRELSQRAFRRVVSTTESNQLAASTWNSTLSKADLIIETFATIASYPDFLYKSYNTGIDDTTSARSINITGLELANKLSWFLAGEPANSSLKTVALNGGLDNPTTFKIEIDKLISSASGKANLQRLFREAYGYDVNGDMQYHANFLKGATTVNLQTAMVQEMDYFFTDEVITKKGKFYDLMNSRSSLVTNASLGQVYGVGANANASITLSVDRPGFLTRAALLTKKSGFYTSPIQRGLYVMEYVLCESVGDPPANAPTNVSESQLAGQLNSTRTRYENLTQQTGTTCAGCHNKVNPYGFALEGYDSLGRKRAFETIFNTSNGQVLGEVQVNTNTSAKINMSTASNKIIDAADLAVGLGSSDMAIMCLAKHIKAFDIRQPTSSKDYCHMNEMLNVLYGTGTSQGSVYDAIVAYVTSKEFRQWKY